MAADRVQKQVDEMAEPTQPAHNESLTGSDGGLKSWKAETPTNRWAWLAAAGEKGGSDGNFVKAH